MTNAKASLESQFIAAQKARLMQMRDELQASLSNAADDAEEERTGNDEAREAEDGAQTLDALERDGLLEQHAAGRLESINRALAKIDNGSYGISTVTGKPIPRARLEAVPEALWDTHENPDLK